MSKALSKSGRLIAEMDAAALNALIDAGGSLPRADLMQEIEKRVSLDAWALEVYEGSGNVRWRSIFGFHSVGLSKGGYVEKSKGIWTITDAGRALVAKKLIDADLVKEIKRAYENWYRGEQSANLRENHVQFGADEDEQLDAFVSPDEQMSSAQKAAHDVLKAELQEQLLQCSPSFFEDIVVQLMLKMGYGGSRQEAGRAVGRTGDGGIDGVISEDRLGLDAIYLQAKRWQGSVGEGPIRDFKGALDAKGASKGVFITTSSYTPAAIEAGRNSRSYKIVLIDGARLAELMMEHNLGVSVAATYQLKKLDSDYFSEE